MEIQFQSDVGRRRRTNQDYTGVFTNESGVVLAILADGMGGHRAGDVASQMVVSYLGDLWNQEEVVEQEQAAQWLIKHIQEINEIIYEEGQNQPELQGMGTTIVAAVLFERQFILANVGDSRAYLIREGAILQLTEDHSLVNELVKSGELTEEMAVNHPRKNILTRSVGMPGTVEVDVTFHDYLPEEYLMLCSDGLTNMVTDSDILKTIYSMRSLNGKVETLIQAANEAGGADNITVLLVHFTEEDSQ